MKQFFFVACVVLLSAQYPTNADFSDLLSTENFRMVRKLVSECINFPKGSFPCLANKAAVAVEKLSSYDVEVFDGLILKKTNETSAYNASEVIGRTGRRHFGVQRLQEAATKFLETHSLSLDFSQTDDDETREGRANKIFSGKPTAGTANNGSATNEGSTNGKSDNEGTFQDRSLKEGATSRGVKNKQLLGNTKYRISKKERRYIQYALMVLLGIFGLTGPLFMKTLTLIAGKALVASKIALLIVGSVALKKIFTQEDSKKGPTVKVHTHTVPLHEDEHDRYMQHVDEGAYNFLNTV